MRRHVKALNRYRDRRAARGLGPVGQRAARQPGPAVARVRSRGLGVRRLWVVVHSRRVVRCCESGGCRSLSALNTIPMHATLPTRGSYKTRLHSSCGLCLIRGQRGDVL
jgi:hypothetical protein